jgi:xylulokinase
VRVPEEEEAAAFGAAIQALWCLDKARGQGRKIEELVDEHVALRDGSAIEPEPQAVKLYEQAYANYSKYLAALSPLYR